MRRARCLALALLIGGTLPPAEGRAQNIVVPNFPVASPTFADHISDIDVTTDGNGTVTFIWGEYDSGSLNDNVAVTRQCAADGTILGPSRRVDTTNHVIEPLISYDTRGGYVSAWWWIRSGQEYSIHGQFMDGTGAPLGEDFKVDFVGGASQPAGVAGLPSGSVIAWKQLVNQLWGQRFDTAGAPIGVPFEIGIAGAGFNQDLVATPAGGFVAAWTNTWESEFSWARAYGADGAPLGPVFSIGPDDFHVQRIAASPLGDIVAAGFRWNDALGTSEVWLVRFSTGGQTLSAHRVEIPGVGVAVDCDVAIDALGKIFVSWSEYDFQTHERRPPRAKAFDPNGNAIIFGFWPTLTKTTAIVSATVSDGRFVNLWNEGGGLVAHVVEIPPPSGVVCGDGVVTPGFEECDDGEANSDTEPDACRTNCLLPRCGDEVADGTEGCDDGNTTSCDGCSATCVAEPGYVCGDGVTEASCGEQCDDGNALAGDGCSQACALEPCVTCTGSPSVCAPTPPATDCKTPLQPKASKLLLRNHPAGSGKDKLGWKYGKGATTTTGELGDPVASTDYELCVYAGTGPGASLLLGAAMPGGGSCNGKPCWKMIGGAPGKGFKYKDKDLTPDGISAVVLKAGAEGRTKIVVKGKGSRLDIPALPLSESAGVTVQLANDAGTCWSDTYGAPAQKNDGVQFKDKGD